MNQTYYVYILTTKVNSALYTGITNDLRRRIHEHRARMGSGFSSRYNVYKLVYYESTPNVESAIEREKQIKAGSRQKKEELISDFNLGWRDLYEEL